MSERRVGYLLASPRWGVQGAQMRGVSEVRILGLLHTVYLEAEGWYRDEAHAKTPHSL